MESAKGPQERSTDSGRPTRGSARPKKLVSEDTTKARLDHHRAAPNRWSWSTSPMSRKLIKRLPMLWIIGNRWIPWWRRAGIQRYGNGTVTHRTSDSRSWNRGRRCQSEWGMACRPRLYPSHAKTGGAIVNVASVQSLASQNNVCLCVCSQQAWSKRLDSFHGHRLCPGPDSGQRGLPRHCGHTEC